jgi:hypothetical protein
VLGLALVLGACAPQTPQTRIAAHPEIYEALSPKHRQLVSLGRLDKGMSEGAVFLAWGNPSRKAEGVRDNRRFERWDYAGYYPVQYHSWHGYYGPGWYGHRGCYGGWGYVPTIEYVPYRRASVWFLGRKVDSWERMGPLR